MRITNRAPNLRPAVMLFFAALSAILIPVSAQERPAGDLFEKMQEQLSAATDFYAVLTVGDTAAYHYFRRDAESNDLLIQREPAMLRGFAYFHQNQRLLFFNPDCVCTDTGIDTVMRARAGFSFMELNPLRVTALPPRKERTGVAGAAVTLEFSLFPGGADESFCRLVLDGKSALPVKLEYYTESGELFRRISYLSYHQIGTTFFPERLRIEAKNAPVLILEATSPVLQPVPDFVFTKAYLEEISRSTGR